MQVGTKELGHKVAGFQSASDSFRAFSSSYMSSRGEMKMSLRLITCKTINIQHLVLAMPHWYIFVSQVFE